MKVYGIRESWDYEIDELVEFYLDYKDAADRVYELNMNRPDYYNDYAIEEIEVK